MFGCAVAVSERGNTAGQKAFDSHRSCKLSHLKVKKKGLELSEESWDYSNKGYYIDTLH